MRWFAIIAIMLCLLPPLSFAQECNYGIEILINGTEFTKESFKWRMKAAKLEGMPANITGTARIEDLSGNTVKSYKPWTNLPISKQKTSNEYTPNLKEGTYKIISEIIVGCDDMDKEDNTDIKTITIRPENTEMQEANAAASPVEEVQEQQTAMKQSQETKSTSSQLINETQDNQSLQENKAKEYENTANLLSDNAQESSISAKPVKNPDKNYEYESSSEKAKNLIMPFLLAISIILNIALIWGR